MAIIIDPPIWPAHGRRWSHLARDTSLLELHAFAAALGIPERAFEGDHYDMPEERYAQTVSAGAIPVSGRELLRRLQVSGLRRSKRRGERVVATCQDRAGGHRIDSVVSALPPLGPVARVHAVILGGGDLLVLPDGEGLALPAADVPPTGPGYQAVGQQLAVALTGGAWAQLPARQVGYLRRIPDGCSRPVGFEVVLRWPDLGPPWSGHPEAAASIGQWVPARRALALLPVDLGPIALAEHHRLRPESVETSGFEDL